MPKKEKIQKKKNIKPHFWPKLMGKIPTQPSTKQRSSEMENFCKNKNKIQKKEKPFCAPGHDIVVYSAQSQKFQFFFLFFNILLLF